MRILFLIRSIAHFSFHESTIRELHSNGHEIDLKFDEVYSEHANDRAAVNFATGRPGVTLGWSLRRSDVWNKPITAARILLAKMAWDVASF